MVNKLRVVFMRKNYKRLIRKNLGLKKLLKSKEINCMLNGKAMIILLIVGLIKKTYYKMSYAPTYSEVKEEIVSVTLNLSNYVTQKEFKSLTKVDTSDFALKTNVAEIKKKVDGIDVGKINSMDKLQGKNYIEDSYLYLS